MDICYNYLIPEKKNHPIFIFPTAAVNLTHHPTHTCSLPTRLITASYAPLVVNHYPNKPSTLLHHGPDITNRSHRIGYFHKAEYFYTSFQTHTFPKTFLPPHPLGQSYTPYTLLIFPYAHTLRLTHKWKYNRIYLQSIHPPKNKQRL
jgi:hypothetical protein